MSKLRCFSLFSLSLVLLLAFATTICGVAAALGDEGVKGFKPLAKRGDRSTVVNTEYGQITAARVSDGAYGTYHLQFITLEPNSLFLPVLLHADMIFYVETGTGSLSWTDEEDDKMKHADLRQGDVYRLLSGSVFYVQSSLEPERKKLRINAIFANSNDDLREPATGPYSSIRDMVLGFDKNVLRAAFKATEAMIEEITSGEKPPAIVHGEPKKEGSMLEKEVQLMMDFIGQEGYYTFDVNSKKKKDKKKKKKSSDKLYNILSETPDFKNCNGWSSTVTGEKLASLENSNIGIFMVNLTAGSMMGPHWNPMATEIAVVLKGEGMVRVVCPSVKNAAECENMRFVVSEGDVFAVPRFHPMAQMAFNNGTFVFMGFSTSAKENHPQYLAGQASVLRALNRDIVATAFNVNNTKIDQLLAPQGESVILECISCAEEEFKVMEEEIARKKEEAKKKEEEARKKEEEEARKKEEEEKRKEEEEEEAKKKEEEKARKEEEERRKREEEEKARKEEEERKEREEEERRKREEEEKARKEEEERKAREEEERRKREEEAAKQEEEEEAERKREEEAAKEEEEKRRQEEKEAEAEAEAEAERKQEEEARKEEERIEEEEEERRREEEAAEREAEEQEREQEEGEGSRGGGEGEETEALRAWKKQWSKKWGRRVLKRMTI